MLDFEPNTSTRLACYLPVFLLTISEGVIGKSFRFQPRCMKKGNCSTGVARSLTFQYDKWQCLSCSTNAKQNGLNFNCQTINEDNFYPLLYRRLLTSVTTHVYLISDARACRSLSRSVTSHSRAGCQQHFVHSMCIDRNGIKKFFCLSPFRGHGFLTSWATIVREFVLARIEVQFIFVEKLNKTKKWRLHLPLNLEQRSGTLFFSKNIIKTRVTLLLKISKKAIFKITFFMKAPTLTDQK